MVLTGQLQRDAIQEAKIRIELLTQGSRRSTAFCVLFPDGSTQTIPGPIGPPGNVMVAREQAYAFAVHIWESLVQSKLEIVSD
jgi:hypothetical protein